MYSHFVLPAVRQKSKYYQRCVKHANTPCCVSEGQISEENTTSCVSEVQILPPVCQKRKYQNKILPSVFQKCRYYHLCVRSVSTTSYVSELQILLVDPCRLTLPFPHNSQIPNPKSQTPPPQEPGIRDKWRRLVLPHPQVTQLPSYYWVPARNCDRMGEGEVVWLQ